MNAWLSAPVLPDEPLSLPEDEPLDGPAHVEPELGEGDVVELLSTAPDVEASPALSGSLELHAPRTHAHNTNLRMPITYITNAT
jgi:hypothetical protein